MNHQKTDQEQKNQFIMGLVAGIAIIVVLGGVFMLGKQYSGGGIGSGTSGSGSGTAAQPTAPTAPTQPQRPEADVARIASVSADDHIRGNANAPITMIEYSDFECPFCAQFHPTVTQILEEYQGKVRLIYRHFPLRSIHPQAQKAAEAAECAADQGSFWEMHDKLFEMNASRSLSLTGMKQAASDLGLDTGSFNDCLDGGTYAGEVEKDYQDGLAGGITGTPGTFINDQFIPGALPIDQIRPVIESLI